MTAYLIGGACSVILMAILLIVERMSRRTKKMRLWMKPALPASSVKTSTNVPNAAAVPMTSTEAYRLYRQGKMTRAQWSKILMKEIEHG